MKHHLLTAVATLALAACGDSSDNGASAGGGGSSGRNQTANEVAAEMSNFRREPGEWEVTMEFTDVRGENLPPEATAPLQQLKGRPQTNRDCVTAEEAARPDPNMFGQQSGSCTFRNFAARDGRITGSMTCQQPQNQGAEAVMELNGTYQPTSYDIAINTTTTMQIPGAAQRGRLLMNMRVRGQRVGVCPAGGAEAPPMTTNAAQ